MAQVFLFSFSQSSEVSTDKLFCSNNISLELPPSRYNCTSRIAHDSLLFYSMSIPDLSRLIELCNEENENQIFISIDKTNACSKQAQDIITDKW